MFPELPEQVQIETINGQQVDMNAIETADLQELEFQTRHRLNQVLAELDIIKGALYKRGQEPHEVQIGTEGAGQ